MNRIAVAAAILGAIALASLGPAKAVEVGVGPGGVYVGDGYHGGHHRWHGAYGYTGGCRVIEREHINRFGERIMVRRRVCD